MADEYEIDSRDSEELHREAKRRLESALEDTEGVSIDEETPLTELLHELQVHKVELEIQNQELRETRSRLQRSREKYANLYDLAPVSYLTLKKEGEIVGANLTAADKLKTRRVDLIGKGLYEYVAEEDRDRLFKFLRSTFKTGDLETCELRVRNTADGEISREDSAEPGVDFYALMEGKVYQDLEGEYRCQAVLSDITERKEAQREMERSEERLRQSFVELAETTSRVLGVRDPYTQEHEQRVAELAREVGERMGLDEETVFGLYLGGLLHDIGKIAIPETILTKPGELKEVEWDLIKSHPKVGYNQILEKTDFPWPVAEMTLHHHERLDGSGYPDQLEGDDLSLEVRILGPVDVVEAMSTRRPYREARSKERTLTVMEEGRGEKFDPVVVDVLIEMIEGEKVTFG